MTSALADFLTDCTPEPVGINCQDCVVEMEPAAQHSALTDAQQIIRYERRPGSAEESTRKQYLYMYL